ncbi:hypothetical protein KsCSTR_39180 [Candidatus Kuenenia stuttgartiensis]|uniref:Uncharacterized protein n=1 Tax=Kuenenia stuttgartiensis TaxID=174633 RepID=Q1PUN0_KUEST|nr:hypothetical protein KsCSTR_39180 [Candidatus Kuenenia stuttgartiensis]CAJ70928.1 unknown protein [Candidatus Kuenenia stuttgartiensis]
MPYVYVKFNLSTCSLIAIISALLYLMDKKQWKIKKCLSILIVRYFSKPYQVLPFLNLKCLRIFYDSLCTYGLNLVAATLRLVEQIF